MPEELQPATDNVVTVDPAQPEEHHLFEVSPTLDESRSLQPHPVYLSLGLPPSAFPAQLGGFPDGTPSPFSRPKSVLDSALRAPSVEGAGTDLIWFFRGDSFLKYEEGPDGEDELSDPVQLADGSGSSFAGGDWPGAFASGVDAVIQGTSGFGGKLWFFKGPRYFRIRLSDGVIDIPSTPITDGWRGTEAFASGIDAGIHGVGDFFGFTWLFKGSQYVRYDLAADQVDVGPRPIAETWGQGGWPAEFTDGIDLAIYGTGDQSEKIYFVRGDQYLLYDLATDSVEEGPKPLMEVWPLLSRFSPPPQLFLREQYSLRTFRGELGAGPLVPGASTHVPAHGKTTFFILTRRSETITEATSSNMLESQSSLAVEAFSRRTSKQEVESGEKGGYDYQVDASYRGHAQLTLLPFAGDGSDSADQNTKVHAQDAREGFTRAGSEVVNDLSNETHETHKQQVTIADAGHVVNVEVETGFSQTIDNSASDDNLNIELFQLTQEYVVVTSLVDAQLVFRNNDPRDARVAKVSDMASLLDECIVDPVARRRIAATVVDVLSHVADHQGADVSLVAPAAVGSDLFRVDPTVHSVFEVKDSQGQHLRDVDVPGIVVHVDRPVVLTPNTEMALVHVP